MNKMVQKNITIISRTFKTLITLVLTIKAIQGQIPSISVNPNPVEIGSEFTAICKVDINNVITFKVNNVVKGTCPFPLGGPQPCTPVDIQQTLATKTTSWTLNATLEYEGIWNCTRLLSESTSLELNMYKCANSVLSESGINSILELNETSAVNISFETACIYPSSNPDVVLQFKSGTEELSSNMNCSASGTACPIGISYECSHQISFKMPLTNDKVFSMQKSYTLHFKASPSIGDCDSVAIFDQFSLRFISTGGNGGNGDDNCNVILIISVFFAVSLIVMTITFIVVLFLSCKFPNIGRVVIIVSFLLIDVVFEIIILWGIEYGSNFKLFKSNSECAVVVIGVVCHLVTLLIEVVKAVVLYRYMNKLKKRLFGTCISPESKPTEKAQIDVDDRKTRSNLISKCSEGRSPHSAEDRTEKDTKPEDVMILMHFMLPEGYSVDTWATEKTSSINDSSKYRPSDRGSLCIKAATKTDNGIYQSILKSNDSEQRINAVLHVTERNSVNLVIHPLIWRRLSSKKLKKMSGLKNVRHKLSTNGDIEMKQEDNSNVFVKSVRWKHNGRGIPSNYNNGDKEVPPLEVIKKDPIDEYHCTVEFSNKKSHVYIFTVKFTGARSGNTREDVIGVPTIMNTKREEIIPSLPPIRHKGTTASANQIPESSPVQGNDLHQVTARSTQSTGTDVNT